MDANVEFWDTFAQDTVVLDTMVWSLSVMPEPLPLFLGFNFLKLKLWLLQGYKTAEQNIILQNMVLYSPGSSRMNINNYKRTMVYNTVV